MMITYSKNIHNSPENIGRYFNNLCYFYLIIFEAVNERIVRVEFWEMTIKIGYFNIKKQIYGGGFTLILP